jgi:hypothetical protein
LFSVPSLFLATYLGELSLFEYFSHSLTTLHHCI